MRNFAKWTQVGASDTGSTIVVSGEGRLASLRSTATGTNQRAYLRRTIPAIPRAVITLRVLARKISGDASIIFDYPNSGSMARTTPLAGIDTVEYVTQWQVPAAALPTSTVVINIGVFTAQIGHCEIYDAKIEVDGTDIDTAPDWVVENGSNANGTFDRFASGLMICRKTLTGLGPINEAWGSGFNSAQINIENFAASFIAPPAVTLSSWSASNQSSWPIYIQQSGTTWARYARLCRFTSSTATDFGLDVVGTGRWFA